MPKVICEKIASPGKATVFKTGVRVGHRLVMSADYYGAAKEPEAKKRCEWLQGLVEKYPESFRANK